MSATVRSHREAMHAGAALSVHTFTGTGCLSPRVKKVISIAGLVRRCCAMTSGTPEGQWIRKLRQMALQERGWCEGGIALCFRELDFEFQDQRVFDKGRLE